MTQLNLFLAFAAGMTALLGALSNFLDRRALSAPAVMLGVGVLVGPHASGLLQPETWGDAPVIIEQSSRIALAIGLMAVALRLSRRMLRVVLKPVLLLLVLGMPIMWAVSSGLVLAMPGMELWVALLIGAAITPTDPVVASSIVTGSFATEQLPTRLRDTVSLESGLNDGLAFLVVLLPIVVLTRESDVGRHWLQDGLLVGVVLAAVIGAAMGVAAAFVMRFCDARGLIGEYSYLGFTIALSLFVLGAAKLAGADALLSVFIAGIVLTLAVDRSEKHDEENVQEAIGKLFMLPVFLGMGVFLPLDAWAATGWPLIALCVAVLALRRPFAVLCLWPLIRSRYPKADLIFLGWFGPVGVSAAFYAALAWHETGNAEVWHVVSAVIAASTVVHGVTAAPATHLYTRHAEPDEAGEAKGRSQD